MTSHDLLILGAGPAGLEAAMTAKAAGLDVLVVDDQPAPGGQIWRSVETTSAAPHGGTLGSAYLEGADIARAFRTSGIGYEPATQLWQIEPRPDGEGYRAFVTRDGAARSIGARSVILATGAQERPVPFPGWTLPGVLTVGAAQILLKSAGQVPAEPVWIAGCGPLPLLYAVQLVEAGGRIAGFLDTAPPGRLRSALAHLPGAVSAASDLLKGLSWMARLKLRGVPIVRHVAAIEAQGSGRLERIRYRTRGGPEQSAPAEILLVHEGLVPNIHATMALGCATAWSEAQDCYVPVLDEWGETSLGKVFVAGDGAGIAGAKAARARGGLAALRVAMKLGRKDEAAALREARPFRQGLARELALRPLLDALYRPRPEVFGPPDDTVICRCEDVTAGEIRALARNGRPGPNQIKAFTRAGMGPCQGRQCGYTVTRILAAAEQRAPGEIGFYRVRPPLKPVTLGELASLDSGAAA